MNATEAIIFTKKYLYMFSNMSLREMLSAFYWHSRMVNSTFLAKRINLAMLAACVILLLSLAINEVREYYSTEARKVFHPLPDETINTPFHETQDLILRKSDLEVPSEYEMISCHMFCDNLELEVNAEYDCIWNV